LPIIANDSEHDIRIEETRRPYRSMYGFTLKEGRII